MAGTEGTGKEPLGRGTVLALVALSLAVFLVANDFTALSVALPNIEHDLDTDVTTVQWVINAYALVFGMAIVSGGRLADMFGRRRIFFIGSALFAAFSAATMRWSARSPRAISDADRVPGPAAVQHLRQRR